VKSWDLLIGGKAVQLDDQIEVYNPSTGELVGSVPNGGEKEAKLAADSAYEAFPDWAAKTALERSQLLIKWHQLIEAEAEEIANK